MLTLPGTILFFCDFETTGVEYSDSAIEVGLVAVTASDGSPRRLGAFESLVRPDESCFTRDTATTSVEWSPHAQKAMAFHGISAAEVDDAPSRLSVGLSIYDWIESIRQEVGEGVNILVSDNIQFEWRHMQRVMRTLQWPFHYCGWDTSLFLESTGVGDPQGVPHRALADTLLIVEAFEEAWRRTESLRSTE